MTINPLATELATEHRRTLLHEADTRRLARAVRRTRTRRVSPLTVRIRPVRPADASLLVDVLARLSPESRLARFLYPKTTLSDAELRYLSDVDHRDHEALIAVTRVRGVPVGVARFIRADDDPASADVAIAVVDDWQSRGVGSLLATRLSARAVGEDISHFTALMAAGNLRARRLLGRLGEVRVADRDGATVTYRVALSGSAVVRSRPRFTSRGARPVGVTAAYLR